MRRLFALIVGLLLASSAFAQLTMTGVGGGFGPAAGGSPASFIFGASAAFSTSGTSPATLTGTFNTGAADIPVVAIVNANDAFGGTITGVSVVGPGALTCIQGTNNSAEQAWLCYGTAGALTTATISMTFTGTGIRAAVATGKVTTTTSTPFSTGNSTAASAGTTSPSTVFSTTGSGGIPTNGVSVAVMGDFFTAARTFSSVTPTQDAIINDASLNGQDFAMGHSTVAGATSGMTFTSSAGSTFNAWAAISWSP